MSSLDIFQEFIDKLDKELVWRKQELENLNLHIESIFKVNQENREEKEFLLRGSIALIYAHWEGGIKNLFIFYVKYINRLLKEGIIDINKIDSKLLETIIFHRIENKLGYSNSEKRQNVINFCKEIFTYASIEADLEIVNTKSNLNFKAYEDLVGKLGINYENYKNQIEIERKFIDTLVKRRNHIAHGESITGLNKDLVIESLEKIINLLELNKNMLLSNGEKLIEEGSNDL